MPSTFRCTLIVLFTLISATPGICDTKFDNTKICPVETPFNALPAVTEITKTTPETDDVNENSCEKKSCPHCCFVDAVFTKAARFPVNEFGTCGQVYETDAVIIYEDMVLQSQGNGKYLVKFVVETPEIPVTMRLQFVVKKKVSGKKEKTIGTITLPPITIDPAQRESNTGSRFWVIKHNGYSSILNECHCKLKDYKVIRQGTARFGSYSSQTAFHY
ncbi:hypothetical protein [Gimesia sp.]|uniref:hypothetical protein n=1 Tax=Gimesia sp. TaxID=2024833 RepID=UPI003A8C900C